jgi:hypothetical protein
VHYILLGERLQIIIHTLYFSIFKKRFNPSDFVPFLLRTAIVSSGLSWILAISTGAPACAFEIRPKAFTILANTFVVLASTTRTNLFHFFLFREGVGSLFESCFDCLFALARGIIKRVETPDAQTYSRITNFVVLETSTIKLQASRSNAITALLSGRKLRVWISCPRHCESPGVAS